MAVTLVEGNGRHRLTFLFPDGWHACQFDGSDFYRHKAERINGMKGVDILATDGVVQVVMEVKDFRGYAKQNRQRQRSGALLEEVAQKVACTLSALLAARRSGIEVFAPYYPVLEEKTPVQVILFLERDEAPGYLRRNNLTLADLKAKLKRLLVGYRVRCQVYDRAHLPRRVAWKVR